MAGRDVLVLGHHLQAPPIGDRAVYQGARKTRRGRDVGPGSEHAAGEISAAEFGITGDLFFQEFEDVVILRRVHRTYDEKDPRVRGMSP